MMANIYSSDSKKSMTESTKIDTPVKVEMKTRKDELLQLAERYITWGFVPIPIRGKVPLLPGWDKTTMINAMDNIKNCINANNVGIVCGKSSNIVVVDIDTRENGVEQWHEAIKKNAIPNTLSIMTGGGGYHYYFQYDERMPMLHNGKVSGMGIDFKTDAGQVVGPGGIHPETQIKYSVRTIVVDGKRVIPFDGNKPIIARMPDWLFELIKSHQK
jgi:hypothetical protein